MLSKQDRKRYNHGDIVYVLERIPYDGDFSIKTCMVDEEFSDRVALVFVSPKDSRLINGIPIYDFQPTRRKKLSRYWEAEALYYLTYDYDLDEAANKIKINDKKAIKKGIENGVLVVDTPRLSIQTDIDKDGYSVFVQRVNRDRTSGMYYRHEIYDTYEEALKAKEANMAELKRQSELTDEEWAKEHIEETISRYVKLYDISYKEVERIKDMIYGLDKIEDVDVRIANGFIQWKYYNKKRWNTV